MTAAFILAALALVAFVAALVPTWPEKSLLAVGGILLAVAVIVSQRA